MANLTDSVTQSQNRLSNQLKTKVSTMQKDHVAVLLGVISVVAFSLTLPFSKVAVQALSGIEVGLLRSFIAGLVAVPILWFTRSKLPTARQIKRIYLGSLGIVYGFPIFSAIGMQTVPVSHGAIVLGLLPLSTAIIGVLLTKKMMSRKFWVYSSVGALLVLSYVALTYDLAGFGFGDLYLGMAMLLAGFGYAQSGQLSSELKGWQVICWMVVLNLPIVSVLCLWQVEFNHVISMNGTQTFALLFLGLVNNLLGFFTWNKALAMGGIAKISQLQLLQTFITYGVAVVFMGEHMDILSVVTCFLVVLIVYKTQQSAKETTNQRI